MMEKPNILIVDDELGPRESLRMILKPQYNVFMAEDGHKALEIIKQVPIDLMTLDLRMPGLSGIDVLKEVKENNTDIEVIIITGYGTLGTITTASQYGVYDYISKPFNVTDVNSVVQKSLEKRKHGFDVKNLLEVIGSINGLNRMEQVKKIFEKSTPFLQQLILKGSPEANNVNKGEDIDYIKFIKVVSDILQNKTSLLSEHSERIHHYASLLVDVLPLIVFDKEAIKVAACFHDIGKMAMEGEFYSEWEQTIDSSLYQEWKIHPKTGVDLLAPIGFSPEILSMILHHHERYDGRGFPAGLKAEDIPLGARIIRIANIYDAMLLAKPFPEQYSKEALTREFSAFGNGELDPYLLQIFLRALQSHEEKLQ